MSAGQKTLSKREELRFWGWGYADEELSSEENAFIDAFLSTLMPEGSTAAEEPKVEDFLLPAPKFEIPEQLAHCCSSSPYDRLVHSYGKSFPDLARMLMRHVPNPPDVVAFREHRNLWGNFRRIRRPF